MQVNPTPNRRREVLLIIFSIAGMLGLLGRATYSAIIGISNFDPAQAGDLAGSMLETLSVVFCALLLLPMLLYSVRRLGGAQIPAARLPAPRFWQVAVLAGIWVMDVIIAAVCAGLFAYGWILAVPFFILGILLPIAGLLWIAVGGQPAGSRRRLWAVFGLGMAGSTVLAVLAEYAVFGLAALAFSIAALAHPEWMTVIQQLKEQITGAGDVQAMLTVLAPYLTNPLVLLAVLAFAAVIGPLIEEALKPAAIWLLGRRLRSPAEGFALGALCGAGFALLEGLLAASGGAATLGVGLVGRAASSLMHITASGLVGWGIASARLEKRPWRFVGAYLLGVLIHGGWNGSAILTVFGALRYSLNPAAPDLVGGLAMLAGLAVLALLFVAMSVLLPVVSRRLRLGQPVPVQAQPPASDIIPPPLP
jgi:hypothetical protein